MNYRPRVYLSYILNFDLNIKDLRYKVGKLTENYEEKRKLRHCDLDLWTKVTNFNTIRASAVSYHLAKTASKLVQPFRWNFVHKQSRTHTHTDTQTNCSENITPPRLRGGLKTSVCESSVGINHIKKKPITYLFFNDDMYSIKLISSDSWHHVFYRFCLKDLYLIQRLLLKLFYTDIIVLKHARNRFRLVNNVIFISVHSHNSCKLHFLSFLLS